MSPPATLACLLIIGERYACTLGGSSLIWREEMREDVGC
jgi:hypothetical protein